MSYFPMMVKLDEKKVLKNKRKIVQNLSWRIRASEFPKRNKTACLSAFIGRTSQGQGKPEGLELVFP